MLLYHAGFDVIKEPDIHYGRKNADFGQGFYTTPDKEFAYRWAKESVGKKTIVNYYELDTDGLVVKTFDRSEEWFEYIFANRRVKPDIYAEYDLIIGPIANDTIYETFGIITSGYLSDEEAMKLMMVGDISQQIVLKTQKAADSLEFISSEVLTKEQLEAAAAKHKVEDERFQEEFAKVMESLQSEE